MRDFVHQRNSNLDIIRIFATAAVVMIHCGAMFVADHAHHTYEFMFANILESISQLGVPLFLMISGALFLDERKQVTLKGILGKNVKNLAIITLSWAAIYAVLYKVVFPVLTGDTVYLDRVFDSFLNGYYHMWYLYMILGLYLITPFLKKIVCKENKAMVLSFILISLVVQFLPQTVDMLCGKYLGGYSITAWVGKFNLGFFNSYIAYFFIGWYIVHVGISKRWLEWSIYVLGAVSLAAMMLHAFFAENYQNAYLNTSVFVLMYATSVFLALYNRKIHMKEKTAERLADLSKLTFGVYVLHPIFLSLFQKGFPYSQYPAAYIIVCFVSVTCSSVLAAYVTSQIPIIKKLIKI